MQFAAAPACFVPAGPEPVLLGGYSAKQCPVRTQNDELPIALRWEPSVDDQARLDAGIRFEEEVFAAIVASNPGTVVIDPRLSRAEAIDATVTAMRAGAPLVLGGWLPDDPGGGRKGRPDILIGVGGGYLPGDVKHHSSAKPAARVSARLSPLNSPAGPVAVAGWSAATDYRYRDGLQLAHYTRMLQACGFHPGGSLSGAVVGTSRVAVGGQPEGLVFVWHDLEDPLGFTFSRSQGKRRRSLMERYDHEHAFRIKVASVARAAASCGDLSGLLVRPIGQGECRKCPYEQVCGEQMAVQDDPSAALTVGGLDVREWLALRRSAVLSTADLAELDPDDDAGFFDAYHREVSDRGREAARSRLRGAIRRAQMIRDGQPVIALGPVTLAPAAVEVDLDIEWDATGLVYLWGVRWRCGSDDTTARYQVFADWSASLDIRGERALAERAADWLRQQRRRAAAAGGDLRVYHWSSPEPSRLRAILGADGTADLLGEQGVFVDLEAVFKSGFLAVRGSSIKNVAPLFGFTWSAADAGGAASQRYLDVVRSAGEQAETARTWLLDYNRDDCAAMAAVRDGMRAWPEAAARPA